VNEGCLKYATRVERENYVVETLTEKPPPYHLQYRYTAPPDIESRAQTQDQEQEENVPEQKKEELYQEKGESRQVNGKLGHLKRILGFILQPFASRVTK
jgi:hypothetical protein